MSIETLKLSSGARLGHYIISGLIGDGETGAVYKAFEPALERPVAVKVLHPQMAEKKVYVECFEQDAKAVAPLIHQNIIPIYYISDGVEAMYFSMAWVYGESLREFVATGNRFNDDRAHWFMMQVITGLDFAMQNNIFHLNLKPSNFLIDHNSVVMLTDFGQIDRSARMETGADRDTISNLLYTSPEQILRTRLDHRSDIYSLGACLFHLMVGRPPFSGETDMETMYMRLEMPFPGDLARTAGVSSGFISLMRKMMERDPEERFGDYAELFEALSNVHTLGGDYKRTMPIPGPRSAPEIFTVPRTGSDPESLHGLISSEWGVSKELIPKEVNVFASRSDVLHAVADLAPQMGTSRMVNTIREMCHPDGPAELGHLMQASENIFGFERAARAIADFMFPPDETVESRPVNSMGDIFEMVGLERSRNLAMTLNCINEETGDYPPFTFLPLWRHQLAVALIVDFMYDALELERTGLEFVAGAFHDSGKLIFAELYPEGYSYTMAQSFLYQKFLSTCERENFGLDHAELGAFWMRHHNLPAGLASTIFPHENRQKLKNGGVLDHAIFSSNQLSKQIGIGFSGNIGISSTPWQEMRSTQFVWEARGNRDYTYATFTADFLFQFKSFPELLWVD